MNMYVTQPPLPLKQNIDVPAFVARRYKVPQAYVFSKKDIVNIMKWAEYEFNDRFMYYSMLDTRAGKHAAKYMEKAGVDAITAEIIARCEFVDDLLKSCMDFELWNNLDKKTRKIMIDVNNIRYFLKNK